MKSILKDKEKIARIESFDFVCRLSDDGTRVFFRDGSASIEDILAIADYLRRPADSKKELFEECWIAYNRKGSKKKSYEQWLRLSDEEKSSVLRHVRAYVQSRERQYQKDFERYLRDRTFNDIVTHGNSVLYDPSRKVDNEYRPEESVELSWNSLLQCYLFTGMFIEQLSDGYTDSTRPDGAEIKLNNARGVIRWSASESKWVRIR